MDVTPSPKMFHAMSQLTDAACGEEPERLLIGPGARAIREKRAMMMEVLHKLVAVAMREGVNRKVMEIKGERAGRVIDKEDFEATVRAARDAEEGRLMVQPSGKSH